MSTNAKSDSDESRLTIIVRTIALGRIRVEVGKVPEGFRGVGAV